MSNQTVFEELRERVDLEAGKSPFFYRRAFRSLTRSYMRRPGKFIIDERADSKDPIEERDQNLIRRIPKQGHLFMFEYTSEKETVKIFDPFPLAYVIKFDGRTFDACNLHLIHPIRRKYVVENLKRDKLTLPYNSISKYNISQIRGLLLDIAINEWDTASMLPVEDFVSIKEGKPSSLSAKDIWKTNNRSFRKMLRGARIYKGYGKHDSNFKG